MHVLAKPPQDCASSHTHPVWFCTNSSTFLLLAVMWIHYLTSLWIFKRVYLANAHLLHGILQTLPPLFSLLMTMLFLWSLTPRSSRQSLTQSTSCSAAALKGRGRGPASFLRTQSAALSLVSRLQRRRRDLVWQVGGEAPLPKHWMGEVCMPGALAVVGRPHERLGCLCALQCAF